MEDFQQTWKEQFSSAEFQKNTRGKSINEPVGQPIGDVTSERVDASHKKKLTADFLGKAVVLLEKSMAILKNYKPKEEIATKSIEKSFNFLIEKAFPVDKDGNLIEVEYKKFKKGAEEGLIDLDCMYIEGIATTTNVDHDQERMAKEAIEAMAEKINSSGVPLINEHQKTWDSKLGDIFKAWTDERSQLHIRAKLDKDNSRAIDLYKAIKKGLQVGLSVAGLVKRSAQELVEALGKRVKTFYDVVLKEISVTNRPSNFDTWLIAKHHTGSLEGHLFKEPHPFYEEYSQNYPSLNWQYEIAKSVAEVTNKLMPKEIKLEEKIEEKAIDTTTETTDETKTKEKAVETTSETKDPETTTDEKKSIPAVSKSDSELIKEMSASMQSLTSEIMSYLKSIKTEKESKETTTETVTPEKKECKSVPSTTTDSETKPDSETKAKSVKKEDPVETTTETTEETEKSRKIAAEFIAKEIELRMNEQGKRIIGPLVETVEKMMRQPLKRKGIASEKAYMMEKNIANNPYREEAPVEEEIKKDIGDEKVSFQDFFKKHYSSF